MAKVQGPFYEELGRRLTQARRAVGVKQVELAQAVGLSRTSIVNIEKGRQPVQIHVLAQLASTLGTNVATLLPSTANPLEKSELIPQLQKLSVMKRTWVERIIGTPPPPAEEEEEEKDEYGSQILASKKEGSRTPRDRAGKRPSRAN